MRVLLWFPVALGLLLCGCSHVAVTPQACQSLKLHVLYISDKGDLLDPCTGDAVGNNASEKAAKDGQLKPQRQSARNVEQSNERAYVQAMIEAYLIERRGHCRDEVIDCDKMKPTVFIHGGLTTFDDVIKRGKVLPELMKADGRYPILIGWPTGPFESYVEHLVRNDRGRQRGGLARAFYGTFTAIEDLARSAVRAIPSVVRQAENLINVAPRFHSREERAADQRAKELGRPDAGFLAYTDAGPYRGVDASGDLLLTAPLVALTTPVVDGLGTGAWDVMLRRSGLVLTKASVYEGESIVNGNATYEPLADRAGDTAATAFFLQWQKGRTALQPIDLIGRSMGAIVSLNVLGRHPALNVSNVVFMGAASRVKDVENVLTPWLAKHEHARFYNLTLDPYNEIAEKNWFGVLPRGSLLMWIDDTFGEVHAFRDRTVGKWWNVVSVAEDLFPINFPVQIEDRGPGRDPQVRYASIRDRVGLKRFPIRKDGSLGPQKHGDFDSYCFWRESYWNKNLAVTPVVETASRADVALTAPIAKHMLSTCEAPRRRPDLNTRAEALPEEVEP